jgi:diguanylate cyclase (GGDEF)-like protein
MHVLLVDDSKFVRTTFNRILSGMFGVVEAADGEAGWQAIESDPSIALVFCDLDMPRLDGFGLLARVRSSTDARIRKLPVIVISGHEEESTKKRARNSGASDFISKTADAPEVLARIEKLLRMVGAKPHARQTPPAPTRTAARDRLTGTLTLPALIAEGRKLYSLARRDGGHLSAVSFVIETDAEPTREAAKEVADQLLDPIARLATEMLSKESLLARTGDAEFTVVLADAGAAQALDFARRLREQLEKANVAYRDRVARVRVNSGVSSVGSDQAGSIEDLMKFARERLRKAAGRPAQAPVGRNEHAPVVTPTLPGEVDRALKILEGVNPDRLGEASNEVLRRLLPFLQGAFKRMQVDFPADKIARMLRSTRT